MTLNALDQTRSDVAGKLAAAGLAVTLDPAANVPFVLVDLVTITGASGIGAWSAEVPVRVVVAPPGDAAAATSLGDAVETILRTLGAPLDASPTTYPAGGVDCPAYVCTYPADVLNPDC